jgi:DNA-binding NarL/FixJ family response regulator
LTAEKLKILVVDDSLIVCNRLSNLLSELNYIHLAGRGENYIEALQLARALNPHVVLLDISIQGNSGLEILKQFKKTFPFIKVIIFTNHTETHYRKLCYELGADYFLDKSSEFESLAVLFEEIYTGIQDVVPNATL